MMVSIVPAARGDHRRSGTRLRCHDRLRHFEGAQTHEREDLQNFTQEAFSVGALGFAEADLLRLGAVVENAALAPAPRG